jgi:hypothetical protein
MLTPAALQRATLLAVGMMAVVLVVTALDRRLFGRSWNDVEQLARDELARRRAERDRLGDAERQVAKWRKAIERRALVKTFRKGEP